MVEKIAEDGTRLQNACSGAVPSQVESNAKMHLMRSSQGSSQIEIEFPRVKAAWRVECRFLGSLGQKLGVKFGVRFGVRRLSVDSRGPMFGTAGSVVEYPSSMSSRTWMLDPELPASSMFVQGPSGNGGWKSRLPSRKRRGGGRRRGGEGSGRARRS